MVIQGLKSCEVHTFEEAILVLKIGEEERNYAQTSFNDRSSRSHTVFQVVSLKLDLLMFKKNLIKETRTNKKF